MYISISNLEWHLYAFTFQACWREHTNLSNGFCFICLVCTVVDKMKTVSNGQNMIERKYIKNESPQLVLTFADFITRHNVWNLCNRRWEVNKYPPELVKCETGISIYQNFLLLYPNKINLQPAFSLSLSLSSFLSVLVMLMLTFLQTLIFRAQQKYKCV